MAPFEPFIGAAGTAPAAWPMEGTMVLPLVPMLPIARIIDVTLTPSMNALPGGGTLQELTNGLGAWALIAALAGLVIGAAAWALGVHGQNFHQSLIGRRAVLVSGLAALLIGAAPPIINFFFHTGTNLH